MTNDSNSANDAIITRQDIEAIRTVLTHMANHDPLALSKVENVEIPSHPAFWTSLENLPVQLVPPPSDFIDTWSISLFLSKNCVWFTGPMWSKEEGQSEMYLYLSKDLSTIPPKLVVEDYRLP